MNFEQDKNILPLNAIPEDALGIQELTVQSSRGMYELCGWNSEDILQHFPTEKIESGSEKLKKAIETFDRSDVLLVSKDINGQVIGCCFAQKEEDKNRIEAMYVKQQYQGTGLAKILFDEAYKRLDPAKDTFLDVFTLNSKGVNFYKKIGFIETGKKFFDERYSNSSGDVLEITEMILKAKAD